VREWLTQLLERLEDVLLTLGRNAGAGVLDGDQHPFGDRSRRHPDLGSRKGVSAGVHQEVVDDPLHLQGVNVHDEWVNLNMDDPIVLRP
jgi:hypothetical protein